MRMAAIIATTPRQAHAACRTRKWYALPWTSCASIDEALHTMTRPAPMSATVTANSVASDVSFLAKRPRRGAGRAHGLADVKSASDQVAAPAGGGAKRPRRGAGRAHGLADVKSASDQVAAPAGGGAIDHEWLSTNRRTSSLKARPRSA